MFSKLFPVRGSDALISLSSILSSLTPDSLDQHLTTLRRDLLTHFIEYVLKEPSSISIDSTGEAEHSITLSPSSTVNDPKNVRIDNLSKILGFLSTHLFPIVPSTVSSTFRQSLFGPTATASMFRQSLFKPMVSSLLIIHLIPSLPSSFGLLAPFLDLAKHAVTFESSAATILTGNSTQDLPIRAWVDGLPTHYEKQRRLELLSHCRILVLSPEDTKDRFQFEIEIPSESVQATIVPVQPDAGVDDAVDNDFKDDAWGFEDEMEDNTAQTSEKGKDKDVQDDGAWGFGDDAEDAVEEKNVSVVESSTPQEDVDNGWGFDDDIPVDEPESVTEPSGTKSKGEREADPGDAWGWNDHTNAQVEERIEDESWDDDPWADSPAAYTENPVVSTAVPTPKTATRLEKLANKGKKPVIDRAETDAASVSIPPISSPSHSISKTQGKAQSDTRAPAPLKRPPDLKTNLVSRESFAVPEKARRLIRAVENIIDECKQFQASSLFPVYSTSQSASSSQAGSILAQSPASLIDLYISIYPVKFNEELTQSVQKGMLFSNSCFYLAHEIGEIRKSLAGSGSFEVLKGKLEESSKNLSILGQSWYEQVIVSASISSLL
jgi:centromere/kinetochore protein ZW10